MGKNENIVHFGKFLTNLVNGQKRMSDIVPKQASDSRTIIKYHER